MTELTGYATEGSSVFGDQFQVELSKVIDEVRLLNQNQRSSIYSPTLPTWRESVAGALRARPVTNHDGKLSPADAVGLLVAVREASAILQLIAENINPKLYDFIKLAQDTDLAAFGTGVSDFCSSIVIAAEVREKIMRDEKVETNGWIRLINTALINDKLLFGSEVIKGGIEVAGERARKMTQHEFTNTESATPDRIKGILHGANIFQRARQVAILRGLAEKV